MQNIAQKEKKLHRDIETTNVFPVIVLNSFMIYRVSKQRHCRLTLIHEVKNTNVFPVIVLNSFMIYRVSKQRHCRLTLIHEVKNTRKDC